ncbi:very long-chain acyl-CoA synthetase-like isoform X1 [Alosa alosa]|uniref:very long-chain acyl-CoA synthetase-like isoform X1 n=1 Tax=Alosa alosa TaxID=278164 RepID=UPI00201524A5|nr:very long-chain acyl-CoA synthetase-like isoform X1 [Alosa alosa]
MLTLFSICFGVVLFFIGLYIRFPYFRHDCVYILKLLKVSSRRKEFRKKKPFYTILDCFLDTVKRQPDKPFIVFEGLVHSYEDIDRQSNRVAWTLRTQARLREGDTVALFVANEPCFVWLWLGLCKLGCAVSLLNCNIRSRSLLHCFSCCDASVLIASGDLKDPVVEVLPTLREQNVSVFILSKECDAEGMEALSDKMANASDKPVPPAFRSNVTMGSPALYIYTSGTTGLPKAGLVTHDKVWSPSVFLLLAGVTSDDVIYTPLPLYHGAGLLIGVCGAIERGITVVLRRKFSTSQFWDDCRKYNVTVIQYIGETLRYLCNSPKKFSDREHRVRLAIGNGLRADVWSNFRSRFGELDIKEFYAASDGNISFMNYPGKIGAIGRVNFFHKRLFPYGLIKFDSEREEPVRDSNGLCIATPQGEAGLLVSKITRIAPFLGYAGNPEQTENKKLHDVFQKGDLYLNSGDLLMIDQDNFIYFQDRIGETFRWKGENVATTEVEDVLTELHFIENATVYGVRMPGHEGRIGMATVTIKAGREFHCSETFTHVANNLPSYAQPRFIRIKSSLEVTGTFKHMKVNLVADGFNPSAIQDPLYVLNEKEHCYDQMTMNYYKSINSGEVHL